MAASDGDALWYIVAAHKNVGTSEGTEKNQTEKTLIEQYVTIYSVRLSWAPEFLPASCPPGVGASVSLCAMERRRDSLPPN